MLIVDNFSKYHSGLIKIVEPNITQIPISLKNRNIELVSFENSLESDIKVLLVDHKEFKNKVIESDYLLDFKGIWH